MPIFDNNKGNKKFIDQKTHNTGHNIPFFWNRKRYFNENVYHCIASILFIIVIIFFIIALVYIGIKYYPNKVNPSDPVVLGFAMVIFLCLIVGIIIKLTERRIRKNREQDFLDSKKKDVIY